jgi:DNA-binding MarR family transcriptional regulator
VDASIPLARLFAMGYHQLIEGLHARLVEGGWHDVRPSYGFVLLAARHAPTTPKQIAALMGTTKQAASALVTSMESAGYLEPRGGSADRRVKRVALTPRARRLLVAVEDIYADLEAEWAGAVGREAVEAVRTTVRDALLATNGGTLPGVRPTH